MPVYKAEKYISRCIDSIMEQTLSDFELILIDDGSPDNSGKICDEYALKDKRIVVIHQENQGVSAARQKGLDTATGEYVIHADPDDWVEPDWLESLYLEAERTKADMVMCDFERVYSDKAIYYSQKPTSLKNEDILEDLISERIWGPCWNKLVRRDCFQKYNVCFNPEMNLWEDLYVNCMLLTHSIKVAYISKALYHYDSYSNENSIVRYRNDDHIRSALIFTRTFAPILSDKQYEDAWYIRKTIIKIWIFRVHHSQFSIIETLPEVNERFIAENKTQPFKTEARCIALCLQGHEKIGHFINNSVSQLRKIIKKCKVSRTTSCFLG